MREFTRPLIVVSKCLGFESVRWNGQIIREPFVKKLGQYADYIKVCPEVEIGLGVPRKPVRVVARKGDRRLIQLETEHDLTEKILAFSDRFLSSLSEVDGFLLKSRSPSSGFRDVKVYPNTGKVAAVDRGSGFFGGAVLERFPLHPVEDEGRLNDFKIRESWLTRVFAHADFRNITTKSMGTLVDFHSRYKLLLMAYSQKYLRELGRVVANHEKKPFDDIVEVYAQRFARALATPPRRPSIINVLMHGLGYFKGELSPAEKGYFLDLLDDYREGVIPLIAVTSVLRSWAVKYRTDYLLNQAFFNPFPAKLFEVRDSGKKV
jgi:uncharacterized protein YbgA (DUF1722 family)/uncharacterized protein YbbK (DUF523 family)